MFPHLNRTLRDERGFTLIELLVVILIIGILAAIAIPSFLNQRGKGFDASAKSNAKTVQTAFESYYTDNNRYCPAPFDQAACITALKTIEPGVYVPDELGVRIEDLVVVTDGGSDVLSGLGKELVTVG